MRALNRYVNRYVERVFNPDRKEPSLGPAETGEGIDDPARHRAMPIKH
jgi:hypothetical protein